MYFRSQKFALIKGGIIDFYKLWFQRYLLANLPEITIATLVRPTPCTSRSLGRLKIINNNSQNLPNNSLHIVTTFPGYYVFKFNQFFLPYKIDPP